MLAVCRRQQRVFTMGLYRGGDVDRVDRWVSQKVIEHVNTRHTEFGGERPRPPWISVPHADNLGVGNLSPASDLDAGSVPGAEQRDSDHRSSQGRTVAPRSVSTWSSPAGKKSPRAIASRRAAS
jgi:hypothetical protein